MSINDTDREYLTRAVDLAEQALETGDGPFGSVLVGADGTVLFEDHNHEVSSGDATQHPEFAIARWAATHLTPQERAEAVVYTSGEHCPMCSAAHAWAGLGRIVYAGSTAQLVQWRSEVGAEAGPVQPLAIGEVAPGLTVDGPEPSLTERLRALHHRAAGHAS